MIQVSMQGYEPLIKKFQELAMSDKDDRNAGRRILSKAVRAGRKDLHRTLKAKANALGTRGKGNRVPTGMAKMISKAVMLRKYKRSTLKKWGIYSGDGAYVGFNVNKYPELIYFNKGTRTAQRLQTKPNREGMKGSGSKSTGRAFIPFAIEYGHASPGNAGGSKTTPPYPFMRVAWAITKGMSIKATTREMVDGIYNYWYRGIKP